MSRFEGSTPDSLVTGLSDDEINLRKKWLELSARDESVVVESGPEFDRHIEEMMEDMYSHFLSLPETRAFFPDKETLERARSRQTGYFRRLTGGNYGVDYVRERLQVGLTHMSIGLSPEWYLGAFDRALSWVMKLFLERLKTDPNAYLRVVSAFRKLLFFDMGLAIEAYMSAKEKAILRQRDTIAELETSRRVTKSLLESAPIGIVHLDADFLILECNGEFLTILGTSDRTEALGKDLFELAPHLHRAPFEQVLESGQAFHATAAPLQFSSRKLEAPTYWDWAAWPLRSARGKAGEILAEFTSATERVLLQQQREEFVATLTHDLKTPILAANRAVKLLIEGDFGPVSQPQARILETIYESNEGMYNLVQTLLDVYRYDSGAKEMKLSSYNLAATINRIVTELQPLARSRSVSLESSLPDFPTSVVCDEEEIRRVVQNLIDNALKHTPAGGTIAVRMEQTGEGTTIEVIDTGKGIREEDIPKLFQRFWQDPSSGRYYASTGLGLYLCRKIVELHGGQIWCESKEGRGSTFAFRITSE